MVKMVALYRRPSDRAAFLEHYERVHMPLARQLPGLRRVEVNHFFDARGGDADPFLMAELFFDSKEAMFASLASPQGKASGRDLQEFAGSLVEILFAEVETEGS